MKNENLNILPLLNFLNNKIEVLLKLNIKNPKMNKLFTSFIHLYSLILYNFENLNFNNENLLNHKQIEIFNSGNVNINLFNHKIYL